MTLRERFEQERDASADEFPILYGIWLEKLIAELTADKIAISLELNKSIKCIEELKKENAELREDNAIFRLDYDH